MRILFAGTPEFATPALSALLEEHDIVGVYTQPDRQSGRGKKLTQSPVKQLALQHNLDIYQPTSLHNEEQQIKMLEPDVFVVDAFGMLLPQSILDIPKLGCINIHGSILPRWRGAAPIQRSIEAGDVETGVSIMLMEIGLDTGPVFQTLKTPISEQDTSQTLHNKLADLGAEGIRSTLSEMQKSLEQSLPIPQAKKQDENFACYAKKITKQQSQISWLDSAESIQRRIRAFNPWPICQTNHNETRIRIWRSSVVDIPLNIDPSIQNHVAGQIIEINNEGVLIACGSTDTMTQSILRLEILQRDGSKPLKSNDFLNGYDIFVGDNFT